MGVCLRCGRKCEGQAGRVHLEQIKRATESLSRSPNMAARKAAALIRGGGLKSSGLHGVFLVRKGADNGCYIVTRKACNCAAGAAGTLCYHRVAVIVVMGG